AAHSVASAVIDFGLILLIYFYLLRDGESYYEEVRKLTPLHEDDKKVIFDTLRNTLTSVMRGLMLTAALQGVTIGLGMAVLRVPYWAFLSIITGVAGLTPFGGTALVWIPAAIYLYAIGNIWSAAILVGWSAVCLAIIDNFIKPMAMRHGTGLPTVALFF